MLWPGGADTKLRTVRRFRVCCGSKIEHQAPHSAEVLEAVVEMGERQAPHSAEIL